MQRLTLERFASRGLKPFDLCLEEGEFVSLAGPSGCGKSLLLRAIADLDPHSGDCLLGIERCAETPPPTWRCKVGLLPAESHWWSDLVGDHFAHAQSHVLRELGFPEECLSWDVARLSSGERQRLSLARLLSGQPMVLLLDEPTANLDQTNTRRVEAMIVDYLRRTGAAALWVSHDPDQRKRVGDRGLVFTEGRLEPEPWT